MKALILAAVLVLTVAQATAEETLVTLHATVTGNQEQPRVMYIMPWQQPGVVTSVYKPGRQMAEDLFRRIDREEFLREMQYRAMLANIAGEAANAN